MNTHGALVAAALFACNAAWVAHAQAPSSAPRATAESVRQAVRDDRRALVEKNMQLTDDEAKRFWPLYDEYQKEMERVLRRQNRALTDYVNTESSMTDANANRIAREILAADAEELRLRERQLRKLTSVLPPKKAVRFMQIENKIRTIQRYDVAEQMPLVR